jgi:hypothetical protein
LRKFVKNLYDNAIEELVVGNNCTKDLAKLVLSYPNPIY